MLHRSWGNIDRALFFTAVSLCYPPASFSCSPSSLCLHLHLPLSRLHPSIYPLSPSLSHACSISPSLLFPMAPLLVFPLSLSVISLPLPHSSFVSLCWNLWNILCCKKKGKENTDYITICWCENSRNWSNLRWPKMYGHSCIAKVSRFSLSLHKAVVTWLLSDVWSAFGYELLCDLL